MDENPYKAPQERGTTGRSWREYFRDFDNPASDLPPLWGLVLVCGVAMFAFACCVWFFIH